MSQRVRAFFMMGVLWVLAACAAPPSPVEIRPGITQATNLDAIRPPSGVTYRYDLVSDGNPVPVDLSLTSRRRSATVYDYTGALIMTLPRGSNLEQTAKILSRTLKVDDLKIGVRGNQLSIPVKVRTDNRFRSLKSQLFLSNVSFAPHDCFAVIGTCRYTSREDGRSIALISETTEANGVWRTRTRPDPAKRRPGDQGGADSLIYSIDRNAVLIDMAITSTRRGERSTIIFRRK